MAQPTTPVILPANVQHNIIEFHKRAGLQAYRQWNLREQMRQVDLQYQREMDQTKEHRRAKVANKYGDSTRFQNITVPVVMPQVEAAVVYQTSVFLQGTPIFGVVASPQFEDQAKQLETVIEQNSIRGGWTRELILFLRDGFKYNLAAVEVNWAREVTAALDTDLSFGDGKQGKPKEVIWEGNTLKRMDMYNTFWDTRVAPADVHKKGEFAGYNQLMGRVALKQFIAELPDKTNVREAFSSGLGTYTTNGTSSAGGGYYIPPINDDALVNRNQYAGFNWINWVENNQSNREGVEYKEIYEVTTLYARIIPSEFGLSIPAKNTPQVWKFIIVNHQVVLYAERLTNAHGYIPMLFCQPLEDGLTYQTKSLANNVAPIQQVTSALLASVFAASRRSISDRGIYDPSRITEAQINNPNPSAKIPVRPAAYGKPLGEAYYSIPFRDEQSQFAMQKIAALTQYANVITGQNPARQGQFVKGNKTTHEFDSVMNNANGRDQLTSFLLEAQLFTPLKEILKINILQFQGGVEYFSPSKNSQVKIDPVELRKAVLQFKVSDGLTPTDKLINADVMMVAMQQIGSSPQIGQGYNIAPLFSYLMKTQGAELSEFEKSREQVAYEQAVGQWQQLVLQMQKQNPAITPNQFPPQPVPQQFGYVPGALASEQQQASQQQEGQVRGNVPSVQQQAFGGQ